MHHDGCVDCRQAMEPDGALVLFYTIIGRL
jgi:hypothetical protein